MLPCLVWNPRTHLVIPTQGVSRQAQPIVCGLVLSSKALYTKLISVGYLTSKHVLYCANFKMALLTTADLGTQQCSVAFFGIHPTKGLVELMKGQFAHAVAGVWSTWELFAPYTAWHLMRATRTRTFRHEISTSVR